MDSCTAFMIKIANKNQLRQRLKEKKRLYAKCVQHPEMVDVCDKLHEEIVAVELQIKELD